MSSRTIAFNNELSLKRRAALMLFLPLALPLAGCIGEDDTGAEEATDEGALPLIAAPACGLPASCADVKAAAAPGVTLSDGEYGLYVNGDPAKPWTAFCKGMSGPGVPAEYISLKSTGGSANFSQYTAGGASQGTSAKTSYTKIRIDPATLIVNTSDETFTSSSGLVHHGATDVTSMPFAVAMSCDSAPSGLGNIDLKATPFAVVPNQFVLGGAIASGSGASYSENNQVVNIKGGGFCGYVQPAPGVFNPFNFSGGPTLGLAYYKPAQ